jgi:hypothetical protein
VPYYCNHIGIGMQSPSHPHRDVGHATVIVNYQLERPTSHTALLVDFRNGELCRQLHRLSTLLRERTG